MRVQISVPGSQLAMLREMRPFPSFLSLVWLLSLLSLSLISAADRKWPAGVRAGEGLIVAQVLFRHGHRTPVYKIPNDPNTGRADYGVKGDGQLTEEGERDGFRLGQFLRARYEGFLNRNYSIDQVFVQSSDFDRTIMTAQAALSALFPPKLDRSSKEDGVGQLAYHWQPMIPIHAISIPCDDILMPIKNCPKLARLSNETNFPFLQRLNHANVDFYRDLSEKSGVPINGFYGVYKLWDTLRVEHENGLPLPTWTKDVFPDEMLAFGEIFYRSYTWTDAQKRLTSGVLLKQMIDNMKIMSGKKEENVDPTRPRLGVTFEKKHKLFLYSAHDLTMSALLDTLGVYDMSQPPSYTSAVMLELYKSTTANNPGDYIVKLLYRRRLNHGDETLPMGLVLSELVLPRCKNPCTLQKFEEAYGEYLLEPEERHKECKETRKR